jgi:hypothetical protein
MATPTEIRAAALLEAAGHRAAAIEHRAAAEAAEVRAEAVLRAAELRAEAAAIRSEPQRDPPEQQQQQQQQQPQRDLGAIAAAEGLLLRRHAPRNDSAERTSAFRGLQWKKRTGKWAVQGPDKRYVGSFADELKAARAYKAAHDASSSARTTTTTGRRESNFKQHHV